MVQRQKIISASIVMFFVILACQSNSNPRTDENGHLVIRSLLWMDNPFLIRSSK